MMRLCEADWTPWKSLDRIEGMVATLWRLPTDETRLGGDIVTNHLLGPDAQRDLHTFGSRTGRGQNWAVIASSMLWSRMSAFRMSSVLESLTFQAKEASVVPIRR